jgi:hypothetical protein
MIFLKFFHRRFPESVTTPESERSTDSVETPELVQPDSNRSSHFVNIPPAKYLFDETPLDLRDILVWRERQLHYHADYHTTAISRKEILECDPDAVTAEGAWEFNVEALTHIDHLHAVKTTVGQVRSACQFWPFGEAGPEKMAGLVTELLSRDLAIVNFALERTFAHSQIRIEKGYATRDVKSPPQIGTYRKSESGKKIDDKLLFPIVVRPGTWWDPTTIANTSHRQYRTIEPFLRLRQHMLLCDARYGAVISNEFLVVAKVDPSDPHSILQLCPAIPLVQEPNTKNLNAKMALWYIHQKLMGTDDTPPRALATSITSYSTPRVRLPPSNIGVDASLDDLETKPSTIYAESDVTMTPSNFSSALKREDGLTGINFSTSKRLALKGSTRKTMSQIMGTFPFVSSNVNISEFTKVEAFPGEDL